MESTIPPALMEQVRSAYESLSNLPFRVHVTDKQGHFLFANAEAREFFGLGDHAEQHNIAHYYEDERERRYVLNELKKVPPGEWRKGFKVVLRVKDRRQKVRFSSMPFFDWRGDIYAMLNITDPMNWVERFEEFEEEVGVGLFEVDRYFKVVECNEYLSAMLGYDSPEELKGEVVSKFMWEEDAAPLLREQLKTNTRIKKYPLKLKRKDKGMTLAEMSCTVLSLDDGEITRVKGVLKDVTFKVFYDENPVGMFLITKDRDGQDILSQANQTFARMHKFDTVSEILGIVSDEFKADPVAYAAYKAELKKAKEENRPLLDYFTTMKDRNGEKLDVVVNVRFLPEQNGDMRVGAVYDLTNNVGRHLRTLEADFSALLHTYIATMHGMRDTLQYVIKAQSQDVINTEKRFDPEQAALKIAGSQKHLGVLLTELEKIANDRKTGESAAGTMMRYWKKMTGENSRIQDEDNASWQRRNLIEMGKSYEIVKNLGLPRELLRNIRFEMSEMLRLTSVASLSASIDELVKRLPEFDYFEKYLRRGEIEPQEYTAENVLKILFDEINFVKEAASKRKIAIQTHLRDENIPVNCHKTSLSRAFQSLLNNAVKYSWHKGGDSRPWVDVRVNRKQDYVEIVIENWGVAIRREELQNDEIFKFGKRGRIAEDEGRSGTGIGLYDARNIIEKHGGKLRLTSEPTFGNPPDLYTKPFITKAFITLPISK